MKVTDIYVYLYNILQYYTAWGHQRTGGIPADGRTPRRAADRWAFRRALHYGWAYIHAHAMGEGGH